MKKPFLLFLSVWIGISSCNDPITIGSDFPGDTTLAVEFRDDLPITAQSIEGEPSVTFRNNLGGFSATNYMVGEIDDETFGQSQAITYFTTALPGSTPLFALDNIDSIVFNMTYDTIGFYGDENAVHDLEIRMISEQVDLAIDQEIRSDSIFPTGDVVASHSLIVNPRDSLQIQARTDDNPDSLILVGPHLRIPLDESLPWIELLGDGSLTDDEIFQMEVPGFSISSSPSSSSMFGLDLLYVNSIGASNITFYLTIDGERSQFNIPLGRIRHSSFTNDYTNSEIGDILNVENPSFLYAQSQAGTNIAIDVSSARTLNNSILNSGILRVSIEEEQDLDPIEAFFAFAREDGDLIIVGAPLSIESPIADIFANGESAPTYSLDLTNHLNNVREGVFANDTIFLIAASKSERANRSVILGTDHPNFPLSLELILTNP